MIAIFSQNQQKKKPLENECRQQKAYACKQYDTKVIMVSFAIWPEWRLSGEAIELFASTWFNANLWFGSGMLTEVQFISLDLDVDTEMSMNDDLLQ